MLEGLRVPSQAEARYIYQEIFEEDCYYRSLPPLGPAPVIVDAGANIGLFALRTLQLYPQARLHCFEPAPATFAALAENLRQHRVQLYRYGLSNYEGRAHLNFYPLVPGNSSLHRRVLDRAFLEKAFVAYHSQPQSHPLVGKALFGLLARLLWGRPREIPITVRRLSSLLEQQTVDLLKVDVERAELQVLEGIAPHFERVQCLVMEVTSLDQPGRPLEAAVALLEGQGYQVRVEESGANRIARRAIEEQLGRDGRIDHLVFASRA